VCTDTVAAFAFCPVKRRISHFDEFYRIRRIIRKSGDADAYRNVMRGEGSAAAKHGKRRFFDGLANSFRRDERLCDLGFKQERGKFLAAETRGNVAAAKAAD